MIKYGGEKLKKDVDSIKYLGINLTLDFLWNKHIDNTVNKANSSLAFLRRNLQITSQLKMISYTSIIWPILEYAPSFWDPYTKSSIEKIETVQRRAARYVLHRYHNTLSVTIMLATLRWSSLEEHRKQQRVVMLYKMHYTLCLKRFPPLNSL